MNKKLKADIEQIKALAKSVIEQGEPSNDIVLFNFVGIRDGNGNMKYAAHCLAQSDELAKAFKACMQSDATIAEAIGRAFIDSI